MVPVQPRPAAFLCLAPQQERQALLLDPGTLLGPPLSGKPWSPGIIPVLGAGRESLLTIAQSHQTGCADPLGKKKKRKTLCIHSSPLAELPSRNNRPGSEGGIVGHKKVL